MLTGLHVVLAIIATLTIVVATGEGLIRIFNNRPAGEAAFRTLVAVLITTVLTALGGAALLISGKHPKEWLHVLYAVLAFGLIPFSDNASRSVKSDRMRGVYRFVGGLVCLLVIQRLMATGPN